MIDDLPKLVVAIALATLTLLAVWPALDHRSAPAAWLRGAWRSAAFRRGVAVAVLVLILAAIVEDVVEAERDEWILQLDARVIAAATTPRPGLRQAAALVSRLTGEGLVAVVVFAVPALLLRRRRRDATILAATAAGAWAAAGLCKVLFLVPRPRAHDVLRVTASYGFPSGHTLVTLVICGTFVWLLAPRQGRARPWLMLGVWMVGVGAGASRIVLNAHWPSDVAAALALGALWLLLLPAIAGERQLRSTPSPTGDIATAR